MLNIIMHRSILTLTLWAIWIGFAALFLETQIGPAMARLLGLETVFLLIGTGMMLTSLSVLRPLYFAYDLAAKMLENTAISWSEREALKFVLGAKELSTANALFWAGALIGGMPILFNAVASVQRVSA